MRFFRVKIILSLLLLCLIFDKASLSAMNSAFWAEECCIGEDWSIDDVKKRTRCDLLRLGAVDREVITIVDLLDYNACHQCWYPSDHDWRKGVDGSLLHIESSLYIPVVCIDLKILSGCVKRRFLCNDCNAWEAYEPLLLQHYSLKKPDFIQRMLELAKADLTSVEDQTVICSVKQARTDISKLITVYLQQCLLDAIAAVQEEEIDLEAFIVSIFDYFEMRILGSLKMLQNAGFFQQALTNKDVAIDVYVLLEEIIFRIKALCHNCELAIDIEEDKAAMQEILDKKTLNAQITLASSLGISIQDCNGEALQFLCKSATKSSSSSSSVGTTAEVSCIGGGTISPLRSSLKKAVTQQGTEKKFRFAVSVQPCANERRQAASSIATNVTLVKRPSTHCLQAFDRDDK
ncbi:hypothetical protein FJ364_01325 [Candidatus Dependentiae bacterium]|nr:hypothetical protein [Candidatus Dependentiae bacterium]